MAGVDAHLIADLLVADGHPAQLVANPEQAVRELVATARAGDLIVTIGAGDVTQLGPQILAALAQRAACP